MPTIILIRHGETDLVHNRLAGRLPGVHLNSTGQQQAQKVVGALAAFPIHAIHSSPLERAVETAQPLANARNLQINICTELNELDYGDLTGKTYRQLNRMKVWQEMKNNPIRRPMPGGETIAAAQARAVQGVEAIAGCLKKDETAAVFSHADIIRLISAHFLTMPLEEFTRLQVNLGAMSILVLGGRKPRLACLNRTDGPLTWGDW